MTSSAEEIFRSLVAFDTTSSRSNAELADFICNRLDGVAAEIVRDLSQEEGKVNLMIRLGPEPASDGDGLTLSGHMDCVPATEPNWSSDPFALTDAGDRWRGRGTSDMKGFLALAVDLAASLAGASLEAPLVLLFTYDEEVGTLGAKHWIDHQAKRPLPRSTIIGEPTRLRIVRMHKGHLKLRVRVHGVSAHSGYPHLGVNAIERAGSIVRALSDLRIELESERTDDSSMFEPVPWVPLNLGEIQGGTAINIVPDRCDLSIGVRLLPGMSSSAMVERIEAAVRSAIADPGAAVIELLNESPPMKLREDAVIVRDLQSLTGSTVPGAVSFATDGGWFQELGNECVLFGPGSIEVAHKPDEYILKDEFLRAGEILGELVRRRCMGADA